MLAVFCGGSDPLTVLAWVNLVISNLCVCDGKLTELRDAKEVGWRISIKYFGRIKGLGQTLHNSV